MSQDHLFSAFKRPRETLSAAQVSHLHASAIPQPASTVRRSNSNSGARASILGASRMSLAPRGALQRSSSGGNLQDTGFSTVKRESQSRFSARKSYAPGSSSSQPPPPSARRSSVYATAAAGGGAAAGRPSVGYSHATSFFTASVASSIQKDPRPLRDRTYQARVATQIMDFLLQNGFEMDMKYQLSQNALKSPTQKDFATIFQWLYQRLDPNYRFTKVENDVLPLLKNLRYPYAQSITKSQLAAVGSANSWYLFLGMLHWLMELVQTTDRYQSGDYDDAAMNDGIDIGSDKIIFRYLSRCYTAWLNEDDDHSEYEREMAAAFDSRHAGYREELEILEAANSQLKKELEDLDDGETPLHKLEEAKQLLESDKKKFLVYIEKLEAKGKRMKETNERLRDELKNADADVSRLEDEKKAIQADVDAQGLTPADIDRMNTEREKLSRGLAQTTQKLAEAQNRLSEREADAQSKLEALERAVTRYNTLAYQISIIPATAPNANAKSFELDIVPSRAGPQESEKLLFDAQTGYQPAQLLNRDLRHDIRPALSQLKMDITARIHKAQDETMRMQEAIEKISETLLDRKEDIDTLEARVAAANAEYAELKENMQAEANASNAEIERQQAQLQRMRVEMSRGALELDQRVQSVKFEHDQLQYAQQSLRERLHSETQRIIEDVINFKLHIQTGLEEYEERVEAALQENEEAPATTATTTPSTPTTGHVA